jgi:hypothetical protein
MATAKGTPATGAKTLLAAFNKVAPSASASSADASMSDSSKRPASSSPVKEKLEELKKLRSQKPSEDQSSSSVILDAIDAVSKKLDKMALKSDLVDLETKMTQHTTTIVTQVIDPIKASVLELQERVKSLEALPPPPPPPLIPPPTQSKEISALRGAINKLDPALRRVVFLGWPTDLDADKRIQEMEKFVRERLPRCHPIDYGNDYTGPYSDRKLSKAAWIELSNADAAKALVKLLGEGGPAFQVDGVNLKAKAARTQTQKKRNYSMRKAEELIKSSELSANKQVKIEWKAEESGSTDRRVLVDNVAAFTQGSNDLYGSFADPYKDLSIP